MSSTSQSGIRAVVASIVAGEVGCPKNVWCSYEKKKISPSWEV
jgi:hypothetical protein